VVGTSTEAGKSRNEASVLPLYRRLADLADFALELNVPQIAAALVEEVYLELDSMIAGEATAPPP